MLFAIVAFGVLLAADERLVHAKEALSLSKPAIVRRPELIVGFAATGVLSALALRLVELGEVDVDKEGGVALLNTDHLVVLRLIILREVHVCVVIVSDVLGVGTVDHELLGDAVRLDNDVVNEDFAVGDHERIPSLALVPREFDEVSGSIFARNNEKSAVVADFVDVDAHADRLPAETTVTRDEESLLGAVVGQLRAEVSCAEDDAYSLFA